MIGKEDFPPVISMILKDLVNSVIVVIFLRPVSLGISPSDVSIRLCHVSKARSGDGFVFFFFLFFCPHFMSFITNLSSSIISH